MAINQAREWSAAIVTREEAWSNFDSSSKWTVSLPEHELYFDTQEDAENFAQRLKERFPEIHYAIQRPHAKA